MAALSYRYDGTWEGWLCCVFESFSKREMPVAVMAWDMPSLLVGREVVTDEKHARRVEGWLVSLSGTLPEFLRRCLLTCLPDREDRMLRLVWRMRREGAALLEVQTDPLVHSLLTAVNHLAREAHLLTGFIRFSAAGPILTAQIGPKNCVLPLLAGHFAERFRNERFLIHDSTHGMALVYRPWEWQIIPVTDFQMAAPDEQEAAFRSMWQAYYDAIAIQSRLNPVCRRTHMPMRYWKFMTEFCRDGVAGEAVLPSWQPKAVNARLL